jgi:3-deoxy-D-manno-octulosonic-acid transferase
MYLLYRALTSLASPFIPFVLRRRLARGKENASRLPERLGKASMPRPPGKLVWIHAASVGEANAVIPLIDALLAGSNAPHVLLTTVTVTSAVLMSKRLPERALHQFAPVDTPEAVRRFLDHWRPDVALWVDSELWPNLIVETYKRGACMGIINARMSERSFKRWGLVLPFIRKLLSGFALCFAQSKADAERLLMLGLPSITGIGNLKYDTPSLPYQEAELTRLRKEIGERFTWVAASTHPGEEVMIAAVHSAFVRQGIKLLTIIVPRHATRGDEVAAQLAPLQVARRSHGKSITEQTDIYLADTMGELGLFYRLASVVFMGGTLVPHGGQNPLEPARIGCTILAGPHMENFAAIALAMEQEDALKRVQNSEALAADLKFLFSDEKARTALANNAQSHVHSHEGILKSITQELQHRLA